MSLKMWAELPEDIVESISKKFTSYVDYVRYRCVCRRWRLSTPKFPFHLPTQLPWLMISHQSFFDISSKIYDLNLAPYSSRRTYIYGSSHGWLVIIDKISSEVRLLNPITLATVSLPRFNAYYQMSLIKVVLSSSPLLSDDFTAFALLYFNRFAFCRKGYDSWVVLKWDMKCNGMDAIYKNGSFFVVGRNGMIAVFNVDSLKMSHIEMSGMRSELSPFGLTGIYGMGGDGYNDIGNVGIPFVTKNGCNLVFCKENLLLVIRIFICEDESESHFGNLISTKTVGFKIYKMNENVCEWEQIHSLGEHSLFIGTTSSSICCCANFVGCRPNCIYFTHNTSRTYFGVYSLSNESIDQLPDTLRRRYCHSVWVEPTPY